MLRSWNLKIELDVDNKEVPMYKQLAMNIQRLIETGILKSGDLLPGGREMAEQLHVSRKTILSAMELLVFSGWIENRERVGLFVLDRSASLAKESNPKVDNKEKPSQQIATIEVNDGYPDTQLVPFEAFSRTYRQLFNRAARWKMLGYSDPQGNIKLRNALARAISKEWGLNINEDEIMITRGSQQALFLMAHSLFKKGDIIVMEEPGYENARRAFESAGLEVLTVPVDQDGMLVERFAEILDNKKNVRAVYVTPRYQYPTTVTLSASRRRELVSLVLKHDIMLFEDDFGSHFQFTDHHLKPLSLLLPKTHYIYIGTFSKILAPALRMGFVISSTVAVDKLADFRKIVDIQGDNIMERAILELMENGELLKHQRRAIKVYRERLDNYCRIINSELKNKVLFKKPHGGLALWMEMEKDPSPLFEKKGITCKVEKMDNGFFGIRIGYASIKESEFETLIQVIKASQN